MRELSVVLPVCNEAEGIDSFLKAVYLSLKTFPKTFEVLCIENGSTDRSLRVLGLLQKKYNNFRVLQSEKGWGNAVRKGMQEAKGKYLCYMVSDGQIDPGYIVTLYNLYQKNHVALVKVWRTRRENAMRLVNSRIYNFISKLFFGLDSQDINATPKLLETQIAKQLILRSKNIALDIELLYKLKQQRLTWLEIPVSSKQRERGQSTTNIRAVIEMIYCMLCLRFGIYGV